MTIGAATWGTCLACPGWSALKQRRVYSHQSLPQACKSCMSRCSISCPSCTTLLPNPNILCWWDAIDEQPIRGRPKTRARDSNTDDRSIDRCRSAFQHERSSQRTDSTVNPAEHDAVSTSTALILPWHTRQVLLCLIERLWALPKLPGLVHVPPEVYSLKAGRGKRWLEATSCAG